MKIKCEYCGQYIQDTDAVCPNCGAPNDRLQRSGSGVPKTIEELRAFCVSHKLPLEKMRFFLGQDYRGAKAFGIYEDADGNFVVYKNKADGSRAVRYRGKDEAYAVNEIYQKMKSEISNQRSHRSASGSRSAGPGRKRKKSPAILWFILILFAVQMVYGAIQTTVSRNRPSTGYYHYDNSYYYYQNKDWYVYDDVYDYWVPAVVDEALEENYRDYYESSYYSGDYGVDDFSDSSYYVEPSSWDDDDDWDSSDWDWDDDYDSWDSDWSDWDSDW